MKRTYPFKKSAMSQKTDMQNKYLLNTAQQTSEKLLLQLGSSYSGLNEEYVQTMRQEYGRNIISQEKKDTIFKKLLRSFIDPFTLVLLSLALISFCTDVLFVGAEDRDFTAVIIDYGLFKRKLKIHSRNTVWQCCGKIESSSKNHGSGRA